MKAKTPPPTYIPAGSPAGRALVGPAPPPPRGAPAGAPVGPGPAPAVLELLADGVPRSRTAIAEALADRHHRMDVVHTLIRSAVDGEVVKTSGQYAPRASGALESGRG